MLKFCKLRIINNGNKKYVGFLTTIRTNKTNLKSDTKDRPVISCKRDEYNFYAKPLVVNKIDTIKLASKGWHNKKSKGDYFVLQMSDNQIKFENAKGFDAFGLSSQLISNIELHGITQPTIIQSKSIPVLLNKKNAIIAAETGSGKTLAYLLPAIQQIIEERVKNYDNLFNSPVCLIITPSRELAYQIDYVVKNISKNLNISSAIIVGGGTKRKMLNPSFKKIDILVATLGALSKLTTTGIFKMSRVRHVILDESDTLLDESFSEKLLHFLKKFHFYYAEDFVRNKMGTQLTLVSATMPTSLPIVISKIVDPESLVQLTTDQLHRILAHVPQRFLRLGKNVQAFQLLEIIKNDIKERNPVIIFSNTAKTCDWISMFLGENGIDCINLNGSMPLALRKNRFVRFQNGEVNVISCTDLGSRGLDTIKVKHVINFNFPKSTADYIHRCGRTGRIGSSQNCQVTNFITTYDDIELVQKIEMSVRQEECLPNIN